MKLRIPNAELQMLTAGQAGRYPRYTTQLMNLANQNAQGTRPPIVGQMTELIAAFEGDTFEEWEIWYAERYPDAVEQATDRIVGMMDQLRDAIQQIDRELIRQWVEELILVKTFIGLRFQEPILKKMAGLTDESYRLSTTEEEAKGIDGYVGDRPVSIKPHTYRAMQGLSERIDATIVYYTKQKDGLLIEYDD